MKFFVSTGEVSGDLHLSYLVKSIEDRYSDVKFFGVAGKHSRKVGVNIIQDIDELAIMGFTEAIKKYRFLKKKMFEYIEFIRKEKIDKVILVDYGGFNIKFLEVLKREFPNIEIFYYIPPKVWIWGEKRVEKLRLVDKIIVIFPWEVEFYKKHNIDVLYYGNPFTEKYQVLERDGENILLLPGSRKQEIKTLLPIMLCLVEKRKDKNFILKFSDKSHLKWCEKDLSQYKNLVIEFDNSLEKCVKKSKLAIATSGTVTLELALLGIPTIVVYKTNWINAFIARYIIKVGFVSLPNLTVDKEVFPELLQERCNEKEIEIYMDKILRAQKDIEEEIYKVRKKLSGKNIIDSYGDFLVKGER